MVRPFVLTASGTTMRSARSSSVTYCNACHGFKCHIAVRAKTLCGVLQSLPVWPYGFTRHLAVGAKLRGGVLQSMPAWP